nr:Hint domain-containing protein [uncultured Lichenicoccus sp.]
MGTYSFTGVPVFVTVSATGTYDINAFGAQGGVSSAGGSPSVGGGLGAEEEGSVSLTAGEQLEIVVGGMGGAGTNGFNGGGGGGGTFVLANTGSSGSYLPLLIAGGGGGGYETAGSPGSVGASGTGSGGGYASVNYSGGGGGGIMSAGSAGSGSGNGGGGASLAGMFAGGAAGYTRYELAAGAGGFGGGGGGGANAGGGGGGGGYSGGSGGNYAGGGGGTSFDAGAAVVATTQAGVQTGDGSLTITPDVACYVTGTLIPTAIGERPVEALAIGDLLVTASGARRPVKWIGRRAYAGRFLAANPGVQPVRFRAGSLGEGLPRRDLLVSPEHAMGLDGVLVPARCLVDDRSILQEHSLQRVDYVHVELDSHDLILAEGAASETFVDNDSRGMFRNVDDYAEHYPDASVGDGVSCLPRLEQGPALHALRRRLAGQITAPSPMEGRLDTVDEDRITGWARNLDTPGYRIRLRVRDNGAILGEIVADSFRIDLLEARGGDGCYAFSMPVPGGLSPALRHVITVERACDGTPLDGSGMVREAMAMPEQRTLLACGSNGMRGMLDLCSRERMRGWAYAPVSDTPVALQITDNGIPLARVLANEPRGDLAVAGIGTGRHGFDLLIPGGLSPLARHVIDIRRERDGARLPGAPMVIEPAAAFGDGLEGAVAAAVGALAPAEQEQALVFLRGQAERLQQDRADRDADRGPREAARRQLRRWGGSPAETARRALVVDSAMPRPGHSGGDNAILSHIAALQRLGHVVSFVAADQMQADASALEATGVTVFRLPFYALLEDVLRRQSGCFDVVYLHRGQTAARFSHLVRQYAPDARLLYSVADLGHVRLARQASLLDDPALRALSRRERSIECAAAAAADAVLTHSDAEAELLRRLVPGAQVHRIPWSMPPQLPRPAFGKRRGVAFIGSFGHAPNADAAVWLVQAVMPLVWRQRPRLECVLAGRAMPEAVLRLARPGVAVLGEVADLDRVYDRVRLTVAPLRYGAGVKSKVLESFAAGLPCVMTPVAAEGIGLGADLQALVGRTPEELADRIVRLHDSAADNRALASRGVALIRSDHDEASVDQALRAAIAGMPVPLRRAG